MFGKFSSNGLKKYDKVSIAFLRLFESCQKILNSSISLGSLSCHLVSYILKKYDMVSVSIFSLASSVNKAAVSIGVFTMPHFLAIFIPSIIF